MARQVVVLVSLALSAMGGWAHEEERHVAGEDATVSSDLAPGWSPLTYSPPAPGSYELPPLGRAADGNVLEVDGEPARLADLFQGKLVVLAFIYTRCDDVNGCPLATAVMRSVAKRVVADGALRDRVRILSLSFDPDYDTPDRLAQHGRTFVPAGVDWHLLTTSSAAELDPILEAYGQSVTRDRTNESAISHILRVFLIDEARRIRNIYSTSFLHADSVVNDLHTLALDSGAGSKPGVAPSTGKVAPWTGPGDVRQGYENRAYTTRSYSIDGRAGRAIDLLGRASTPQAGLPPVPVPADNPLDERRIALGRKLFFDRRLSHNATLSCAMCHVPEQGFTSNEIKTAIGIEGSTVRRNAPTIYNVAYLEHLFHDGREHTLEQQVWLPLLAANEMGNVSIGAVIDRLSTFEDYAGLFEAAFNGRGPSMESVGQALASYERTLVAGNSPFDRWRYRGDSGALGAE
ncbi:MAG: cytochrome c peroxidase, partial [Gammaproteobacteria bacterium]